jgi:hypothetical protein
VGDEVFPADFDIRRPQSMPAGHIRVLDVENLLNPVEVGQYRIPRAGTHKFWAEDDVLYVGYFNAGLRAVDISGSLRGDLGQQGREIAALATTDADAFVEDRPFTWAAMPHKDLVFASDYTSGLWVTRLIRSSAAD